MGMLWVVRFMETTMIAAYVRTSTRRQKDDSQRSEINKWFAANGIAPEKVEWYADQETGKTLDRPEFARLQKNVFEGKIKTIVIWKLDRLSRRLRDGINTLADWCEKNIKIVVITQQIELSGAVGRMMAALLLGLAEIELEYRQERQAAGIEVAKIKGVYTGRRAGTTKAKPKRAKELREKGLTVEEIAQAISVSPRTVWRYLDAA
jgi:DNA invertase Pin-like site-specific DNA recombinase